MENSYGIGTNNRYELFCLDDDTSDATGAAIARKAKQQKKAAAKAAAAAAEKENKATAAAAALIQAQIEASAAARALESGKRGGGARGQQRPIRDSQNIRGGPGGAERQNGPREENFSKSAFPRPAGDREQRFNRRNAPAAAAGDGAVAAANNQDSRPPRRANGFAPGAQRRAFDRKSGSDKTGVKAVDKREGGGAHNWGTHKQDIEDLNKSNSDWETDKEAAASAGGSPTSSNDAGAGESGDAEPGVKKVREETAEQAAAAAAAAEAQRLAEEEARELTLDEYRAQRGIRAKPQFNIRKAGEGEDTSQWKKMIALQSRKKTEADSDEELEYDPSLYPQRVGRQKHLLEIEFHFNDSRRSGGLGNSRRGPGARPGPGGFGGRPNGGPVGGARPPRRDQRNGGDVPVAAAAVAPAVVAVAAEVPTVEVVVEESRPVEVRKPRAPRNDDRRRPFEDRQHRGGYAAGIGQHAPQVNDERAFPSLG